MSPQRPIKTIYHSGRVIYRTGRNTYHPVRARNGVPLYDFLRENRLSQGKQ